MGNVQTIIVIIICALFVLTYFPGYSPLPGTDFQTLTNGEFLNLFSLSNLSLTDAAIGVTAIAAGIIFPNPYTLFFAVLTVIYGLISFITNVILYGNAATIFSLNSTSNPMFFINAIISIIFTFALINWYSQREPL